MSGKLMGECYTLELPSHLREVLTAMADHGNDDGSGVHPTVPRLAWKLDVRRRTVQRNVRELEARGILVKVGIRPEGNTEWRIDLSTAPRKPEFDPEEARKLRREQDARYRGGHTRVAPKRGGRGDTGDTEGVTPGDIGGDTERHLGVTPVSPEPSSNRPSKPSEEPLGSDSLSSPTQPFSGNGQVGKDGEWSELDWTHAIRLYRDLYPDTPLDAVEQAAQGAAAAGAEPSLREIENQMLIGATA